ncbi:hypothetical protein HNP33_001211 [Comamonas odontotermitis]|uniref:Uncharacterized protein n=1 Tax=Comamonas odontotermitis TaxID=379895 RepID=A0ABR6RDB7_9BURK|nr:hypothetical protein [Comamonas odontotermitis]
MQGLRCRREPGGENLHKAKSWPRGASSKQSGPVPGSARESRALNLCHAAPFVTPADVRRHG